MIQRQLKSAAFFILILFLLGCETNPPHAAASRIAKSDRSQSANSVDAGIRPGDRFVSGLMFRDRLWLLNGTGGLFAFDLSDGSHRTIVENSVIDIKRDGDRLWILRTLAMRPTEASIDPHERRFILTELSANGSVDSRPLVVHSYQSPLALLVNQNKLFVLLPSSVAMLQAMDAEWRSIKLTKELRAGVQTAVAQVRNGEIYVGVNMGEWGGGLQRVDLTTGGVIDIEHRHVGGLCAGPLNSDCDPVTAIISDPLTDHCVVATIGLVHLISHGRILRVCGDQVTVVFEKKFTTQIGRERFDMHEAFYDIAPMSRSGYWAVSARALYRFKGDAPEEFPLPRLEPLGVLYVSRALAGLLIVRTDVNSGVSLSGYTPLLIPLE